MLSWLLLHADLLSVIGLVIVRLMESVNVVSKAGTPVTWLSLTKEFFRFG